MMRTSQQEERVVPSYYFYNHFNNILHYPQHGLSKLSPTARQGCTQRPPDKRLKWNKLSTVEQAALAPNSCSWSYKLSMKTV